MNLVGKVKTLNLVHLRPDRGEQYFRPPWGQIEQQYFFLVLNRHIDYFRPIQLIDKQINFRGYFFIF